MADYLDKLVARGVISDRAAQRMMTHQAEEPNPAQSSLDEVRRFMQPPDLTPVHEPGTQPADYLRELYRNPGIRAKSIEQASNFNFVGALKLHPVWPSGQFIRHYEMADEAGNVVGRLSAEYNPRNDDLLVNNIEALAGARSQGFSNTKSVLEALKQEFPNARTISGLRISGARHGMAAVGKPNMSADDIRASMRLRPFGSEQ